MSGLARVELSKTLPRSICCSEDDADTDVIPLHITSPFAVAVAVALVVVGASVAVAAAVTAVTAVAATAAVCFCHDSPQVNLASGRVNIILLIVLVNLMNGDVLILESVRN